MRAEGPVAFLVAFTHDRNCPTASAVLVRARGAEDVEPCWVCGNSA